MLRQRLSRIQWILRQENEERLVTTRVGSRGPMPPAISASWIPNPSLEWTRAGMALAPQLKRWASACGRLKRVRFWRCMVTAAGRVREFDAVSS